MISSPVAWREQERASAGRIPETMFPPGARRSPLAALALVTALLVTSSAAARAQSRPEDIRGHWAEERIANLVSRGVIEVGGDRLFRPDAAINRAQFVAWLVVARGLPQVRFDPPSFVDLHLARELAPAVESAVAYGMLSAGGLFRPNSPLLRGDAFTWLVRALGHTFESAYMVNAPLPFADLGGLPPGVRGAIAVAALSVPPLLREPPSDRVRPLDALTRAEAASMIWAYLQGIEQGMSLAFSVTLEAGVTLILEKRGALRAPPVWRVQVGAFQDEERARRLAETMRSRGHPAFVEATDDFFKVRVGNYATRDEAVALQQRLEAEGLPTWIILTVPDYEVLPGPFWSGIVLIEPAGGARLRPALAAGATIGRLRTSEAARRAGAIAATNGGFFMPSGDPLGCLAADGEVISEPLAGRSCVGITDDGQVLFDLLRLDAAASTNGGAVTIDGVNRDRAAGEIILYRPAHGATTRTSALGAEVVVAGETVQQVWDGRGNSPIPAGGYVLSGHTRGRSALLAAFRPGDRVALRVRMVPVSGDPRWEGVRHVAGGGPRLLAGGQFVGSEGFRPSLVNRRHPRTAIGRLEDGRIVLAVIGGRQPYHSLGMTLVELAGMLRRLGATDALNLDGGGSTTLVVRGVVINLPSDEGGERPVGDVLLVLPPSQGGK